MSLMLPRLLYVPLQLILVTAVISLLVSTPSPAPLILFNIQLLNASSGKVVEFIVTSAWAAKLNMMLANRI